MNDPILFVDTETTGLVRGDLPLDAPEQPHLAQLALLLTDASGKRVGSFVAYVKPEGWEMPAAASAINGLTTDYLAAYGLSLASVLLFFVDFAQRTRLLVAHNVDFDRRVLEIEATRMGRRFGHESTSDDETTWPCPWFCTKEEAAPVCCLRGRSSYPFRARESRYKWPTLDEAHRFFCGGPVENAHDALADVEACARVYFALRARATQQDVTEAGHAPAGG